MLVYTLDTYLGDTMFMDLLEMSDLSFMRKSELVKKPDRERAIEFLKVLSECNGILMNALERSSWTYLEHQHYLLKSKTYTKAVDIIRSQFVDIAEKTIIENAMNGDQRAAEYLANNQGKARGWNNQNDGTGNRMVNLNIFVDQKGDDVKRLKKDDDEEVIEGFMSDIEKT